MMWDRLVLVENEEDIHQSLETFNREARHNLPRFVNLTKQTLYWVYNPKSHTFGPGKFVGFKGMNFQRYENAISGRFRGASFHGHTTKVRIEEILGTFKRDDNSMVRLEQWAESISAGVIRRISTLKWEFTFLR